MFNKSIHGFPFVFSTRPFPKGKLKLKKNQTRLWKIISIACKSLQVYIETHLFENIKIAWKVWLAGSRH